MRAAFRGLVVIAGLTAAHVASAQTTPDRTTAILGRVVGIGDTVRVAGRVTLGAGIVDTGSISIFIQTTSGAGVHVIGPKVSGTPRLVDGDSVDAVGRVKTGRLGVSVSATTITRLGSRRPQAATSISLDAARLDSSVTRLVRIAGTVSRASVGRGDHILNLINRIPRSDSASVYVVEPEESADAIGLERFGPDDDVRVTGVLIRHPTSAGPDAYYLIPRSADDIASIGWTHAVQRSVRDAILAATAVLVLFVGIWKVRRELRAAASRTEAALRGSESRYRLLVEQAPVGLLVHRRGRVLFVNSAFATMFGVSKDKALGLKLVDLIHSGDRPRAVAWIRALRNRRQHDVRARDRFKRHDGRVIDIEIATTTILYQGEPAVQVVVHDVTTHAVVEEQLRHSQKMEAIGQLAAGVAHDFNNILTTIAGYSQLIIDDYQLNEELRKDVEEIQRAGERASALTKQLLAVSRRQLVLADVIDLNDVIGDAQQLLNRTIGAHVQLDVMLSDEPCAVFADRGQLEQVVMNLVLNARDAMPDGGTLHIVTAITTISDDADLHAGIEPGEYATLVVRDSGVGMSAETQQRIFDPFFTTKAVGDGSGLGLATMYGIVAGAHGHVSVTSAEGVGSEFRVLLPRVQYVPDAPEQTVGGVVPHGNGARVLLIEDEASVRTAARRILEHNGYAVAEARNGADALLLWHEDGTTFDCVVSDVVLPGMRGPELVDRFRADRPALPVLFVSGYTDRALGQLDLEIPNTAFLQKPFAPKQLAGALDELMHQAALAA